MVAEAEDQSRVWCCTVFWVERASMASIVMQEAIFRLHRMRLCSKTVLGQKWQ